MVGGVAAVAHHAGKQSGELDQMQAGQAQEQYAQQPQQAAPAAAPAAPAEDNIAKLNELKGLLDSGVLTQQEFDAQKQKILAGGI
jgi:membrane protease subunit (stomatin/prohibitin family)